MELIRRTVSINKKNIFSIYLIVVALSGCATTDFVSVPDTQPTNTILKKETSDNNILSIRSALHENRNSIDLYLKLATELVNNQNYSEAIYNLDIALNENPDSFLALNLRGEIHYLLGDFDSATSDFKRSLQLNPSYSKAHYNMARYHNFLGDTKLAVFELNEAIKYNDKNFYAYEMRGKLLQRYRMHTEAIQDFDHSISLRPKNISSLYYRALSYYEIGRIESALDDLNQVLDNNPYLIDALFIRADIFRSLGKVDSAIKDYEIILEKEKNNTRAKKELIVTKRIKML